MPTTTRQADARDLDVPRRSGAAAIGARLRQLSDRVDREASAAYAALGVRFDQRGFGVMNQLAAGMPLGITELARRLGISHPAVIQIRRVLEQQGLVAASGSAADARRTMLTLTPAGHRFVAAARPLWTALAQVSRELDSEAGGLVDALLRLEQALDRRCIADRVAHHLTPADATARTGLDS